MLGVAPVLGLHQEGPEIVLAVVPRPTAPEQRSEVSVEYPERAPVTLARKPQHPLQCRTCPSLPQLPCHFITPTVLVILNQSQGGMCICRVLGIGGGSLAGSVSALDCRTVRQRRLTSSFRLDSPARNFADPLPGLRRGRLCTAALLPRHRLPVASSLAQPQIASSALKSGL